MIEEKVTNSAKLKVHKDTVEEIEKYFNAFRETTLNTYSEEFLEDYTFKNRFLNREYSNIECFFGILSFLVLIIFGVSSILGNNGYMLLAAFSSIPMLSIIDREAENKKRYNKWIKKENNFLLIQKSLFNEQSVSKNILKLFIKQYGEDALKNIMKDKDVVLYKDINFYIENREKILFKEQEIARIQREKEVRDTKIKEVITCLSD